jgi:hypothetical protein
MAWAMNALSRLLCYIDSRSKNASRRGSQPPDRVARAFPA